jgi:PAS domain S-box-containing protein
MTATTEFDEQAALRSVVEGTASATGNEFFRSLVENLARALGTMGGWVATLDAERGELCALQLKIRERWRENFIYQIAGTPCETALVERRVVHIPERVVELYRNDPRLSAQGAVSYLGVPLFAADGRIIGQLGVLDDQPMPYEPRAMAIFQIFANRAAAELERLESDRVVVEREAQLRRLLEGAMDAIVDFDADYQVSFINPAARRCFGGDAEASSPDVRRLFSPESSQRLERCVAELLGPAAGSSSQWVAGGLQALSPTGALFQAEATLSHYRLEHRDHLTLILRDVEERLSAERRISTLTRETQYLREELRSLQSYDRIVGSSAALLGALRELENVAGTETSVLLLGETGTGKELFARTLHSRSKRSHKPLVKLNCGGIPHGLIESELFGHERGAFTGATQRREGRFALADGGTLFLDEIGELPLALQPKLLRVLQEGEFEAVGSSRTVNVDVRIVAATNRHLADEVREGRFREDLFYRLNVFPIRIPPLRERGQDVDELSRVFFDKYTRRLGRALGPLSETTLARLRRYPWPGNVRELENVIERGVIVATSGFFDLDRALPELASLPPSPETEPPRVRTASEMLMLERANIAQALQQCSGKVAGASGAAALLGMHPSTLASRMQSLGIRRSGR